ncbi:unnamed protein product [Rhodiola kirilowii]
MAAFIDLDDSPMFHKQIGSMEQTAEELKDRCQRLHKGCQKFIAAIGEAYNGDTIFADAIEQFGGGQDDPVSMSIGGPVISKFVSAFRELATYKELLRSQVEHVLNDRLLHFMNVDLQNAKESRKQFDKAAYTYDQAREKFGSLKKSARDDVVTDLEDDLQNSKSAFEKSRFNLVNGLVNVETKKKYEFLESFSAIMDAHLRYFKLGYDLLSQMEPFIHQVLTYAQQSKEVANVEKEKLSKRIQGFRTQAEMDSLRASSQLESSTTADGIHIDATCTRSYKDVEAIMQSATNAEVQTIKQGYLGKRSSSLRADWRRRFFVLDSRGALYYYTNKGIPLGSQSHQSISSGEHNSGMFGRFRSRHQRSSSASDVKLGSRSIDLRTSTIKIDAEDPDLRLCFRIISPIKAYTLQAESEADRIDWINKIKGVIASLLNSHFLNQPHPGIQQSENNSLSSVSSSDPLRVHSQQRPIGVKANQAAPVFQILREIPGNDICAECSAPEPDWASLNLGILLCIECSGVHRNLGVHISKVRSITLDVKVWEPTILDLFRALGNEFCNAIWEELLLLKIEGLDPALSPVRSIKKPCAGDAFSLKEKYIQAKYVEKILVNIETNTANTCPAKNLWEAVKSNNLKDVYRLIVRSREDVVNTVYTEDSEPYNHGTVEQEQEMNPSTKGPDIAGDSKATQCQQGSSLLHLACQIGNQVMVELLLQFRANANLRDFSGRTPLHLCISQGNNTLAKFLLRRGASPSIRDAAGMSVLDRAMEMGSITDEELFVLLSEC